AIYWMHSRTHSSSARLTAAAPVGKSTHAKSPVAAAGAPAAGVTAPPAAGAPSPTTAAAEGTAAGPKATAVPLVEGTLDTLLEKARLAMRERRYMAPADASALLYYRSALKVDPTNGEARDGLTRLAGLALSRFDDAMTAGRYDLAAADLADLKVAEPGAARLGPLEARLLQAEVANAFAAGDFARAATLVREAQQANAASPGTLARWRAQLAQGETAARTTRLASLIDQSIHAGHFLAPAGDNAQAYLEQLQSLAPDSAAAARGRRDLLAAYLAKARDDAIAGKSSDADKWVSAARAAGMTAAQLADYRSSVSEGKQQAAANEADRLATLARARIQSGNLIDPANDSAEYYLTQLKSAHGADGTVHAIGLELSASLIAQATAAARAGKTSATKEDLAAARRWGADPVLISAVEQMVNGPSRSEQAASASGPQIPAGYKPRRIRYVAPQYPQTALDAHESGTVTVEFTVDIYGRPRDVHVVESHPHGLFDYATVSAVQHWRFEPPIIDNVPTAIPTRMVIRFVAPN
ncbi:MAG: energy transducer TonB, partial [Steroidobacteraceae bacterium]